MLHARVTRLKSQRPDLAAAYEGVEGSFPDAASRARYRAAMLAKSLHQADFIGRLLGRPSSVLEVGCGNGRLLIELARRGLLTDGIGIDMARSRICFAREWADDERLNSLRFEAADALEFEPGPNRHDAIICVTGMFAYLDPLAPGTAELVLRRWANALRPDGLLVLELYPHPEITSLMPKSSGVLRLWRELDAGDPWRFYLSELRLEGCILTHIKTFIHRTTGQVDTGRRERLMIYSMQEISHILRHAGFDQIVGHEGWTETSYESAETMVVTARIFDTAQKRRQHRVER